MAATAQVIEGRATRRAPTRHDWRVSPGVELGTAPNRVAKELIALALADVLSVRFIVPTVAPGVEAFTVVSSDWAEPAEIATARGIVRGVLLALQPPDPLAADVVTARNDWARLQGKAGRAVAGVTFCCGDPECVITASVRRADLAGAWDALHRLGWRADEDLTYLCPEHAKGGDAGA